MYLSGWLGGPQLFVEAYGHPRLRARHLPFAIGGSESGISGSCACALRWRKCPDDGNGQLYKALEDLADHMRNMMGWGGDR